MNAFDTNISIYVNDPRDHTITANTPTNSSGHIQLKELSNVASIIKGFKFRTSWV
jgi:hypothetical protein